MVSEDGVPLLDDQLLRPCPGFVSNYLFDVSNSIVFVTEDSYLFSKAIINSDGYHVKNDGCIPIPPSDGSSKNRRVVLSDAGTEGERERESGDKLNS